MPVTNWVAPSLRDATAAGVTVANRDATARLLKTGLARHGQSTGPMAEVVRGGTQYLDDDDLQAMLVYLESLTQAPAAKSTRDLVMTRAGLDSAAALYKQHCSDCHGANGEGVAGAYPALAGNRALQADVPNNAIYAVLQGGFGPATAANPRPYGMPPYLLVLSDAQVAEVLTYVRQSWGNRGAPVLEAQVTLARNRAGR